MKNKQFIFRRVIYTLFIVLVGLLPSWIRLAQASFDFSKVFGVKEIISDGSLLILCLTTTVIICAEHILFKMGKYIFMKELFMIIILPLFIILWGSIVMLLIQNISDVNLNLQKASINTSVVCVATLIYVFQMSFINNRNV